MNTKLESIFHQFSCGKGQIEKTFQAKVSSLKCDHILYNNRYSIKSAIQLGGFSTAFYNQPFLSYGRFSKINCAVFLAK